MNNFKNKKAFSLIELSIVILIVGIIIAGVTQSSRLIAQFRLSSARTQTKSAPVPSIPNLVLWLETTLEDSIAESEREDTELVSNNGVATWYDINSSAGTRNNATQSTNANKPHYYANCIRNLPCLKFDGSSDIMSISGSDVVGTNYTIFIAEQRRAAAGGIILGSSASSSTDAALALGYSSNTAILFSQGSSSNYYTVSATGYTVPVPSVHSFVNNYLSGATPYQYHYLNGSATASTLTDNGTPALTTLSSYSNASIGGGYLGASASYFNGDIGEIIIYSRALKAEERIAVEDYLTKKWGVR